MLPSSRMGSIKYGLNNSHSALCTFCPLPHMSGVDQNWDKLSHCSIACSELLLLIFITIL